MAKAKKKETTKDRIARETRDYTTRLRTQKKVKVLGDPIYIKYLGNPHTYDLNGYPVSINFDGTWQEFPAEIAKNLQKVLMAAGRSNTAVNVNVNMYDQ